MQSNEQNAFPGGEQRVRPAVWAVAIAAVIIMFAVIDRTPQPFAESKPVPLEVERSLLTLQNSRLYHGVRPFTGLVIEKHSDGTLRSRSAILNGLLNGVSEGWHTNGVLQIREHFVNGVSHGPRVRWNDEGQR